jgi:glycine cleavage system aminomethyltransferase T
MKRSPLSHHHIRSGATLAEYHGWELPSFFTTPEEEAACVVNAVGLADIGGGMEVPSVSADLLLAGPRSRDVLSKLTSLNTSDARLPNSSSAQASVAHVRCLVRREDLPQVPAYHLLIDRDYAESFWEAVLHAGREFELRPFGWDALQLLGG